MDIVPGGFALADLHWRAAAVSLGGARPNLNRPGSEGARVAYQIPAPDIVSIIDAPPTPVAALGPGRKYAALVHYEMHPPVATLARPYLSLAGVRVDPA